jgi:transposase-like protein
LQWFGTGILQQSSDLKNWSVVRLAKFCGLNRSTLRLHLKECEFRFNHRPDNLYQLLLKELKNNPLRAFL